MLPLLGEDVLTMTSVKSSGRLIFMVFYELVGSDIVMRLLLVLVVF